MSPSKFTLGDWGLGLGAARVEACRRAVKPGLDLDRLICQHVI